MKVLIGIVSSVVLMATCHATPLGSKRVCHVRPTYEFEYELTQALQRRIPTFEELDTNTDGKVVIVEFTEFNGKISDEFKASYIELMGRVDDHKTEVEKVVQKLFEQADVDDDKAHLNEEEFETFVGYFSKVEEIKDVGFGDIDKADDCMVSFAEIKPKFVEEPVEKHLVDITAKAEEDKAITEAYLNKVFSNMDSNCDGSLDNAEYAVYTGPSSSIDPPVCSVLPMYNFEFELSQAIERKMSGTTPTFEELDLAPIDQSVSANEFIEFNKRISDEFQASYSELKGKVDDHKREVERVVRALFEEANTDVDTANLDSGEFATFMGYFSKVAEIRNGGFEDISKGGDGMVSFAELKQKYVDDPIEIYLGEINSITAKAEEDKAVTEADLNTVFSNSDSNCDGSLSGYEYTVYASPNRNMDPPECSQKAALNEADKAAKEAEEIQQQIKSQEKRREQEESKKNELEAPFRHIFDQSDTEDDDDKLNAEEFEAFQSAISGFGIENVDLDSVDGNVDQITDGLIAWEEAKKQFLDKIVQGQLDKDSEEPSVPATPLSGSSTGEMQFPQPKPTFDADGKISKSQIGVVIVKYREDVQKYLQNALEQGKQKAEDEAKIFQESFDAANTEDEDEKLNEKEFEAFKSRFLPTDFPVFNSLDNVVDGKIDFAGVQQSFANPIDIRGLEAYIEQANDNLLELVKGYEAKFDEADTVDNDGKLDEEEYAAFESNILEPFMKDDQDDAKNNGGGQDESVTLKQIVSEEIFRLTFDEDGKAMKESVRRALANKLEEIKKSNEKFIEDQKEQQLQEDNLIKVDFDAADTEPKGGDGKLNAAEFWYFQDDAGYDEEEIIGLNSIDEGDKDGKIDWEEAKKHFVEQLVITVNSLDDNKIAEELTQFDEKYALDDKISSGAYDSLVSDMGLKYDQKY